MSRREQIRMTPEELHGFLDEQRVVTCASLGRDGWPHLMPLWFVLRGERIWAWTYARSQKVRNLERDARATLQVENGERYDELRGVMLRSRVELHRETEDVARVGAEISARYAGTGVDPEEFMDVVRAQAAKRVALEFAPEGEPATWDHRKLGGKY